MWQARYAKVFPGLTRDAVWRVWSDVNRWAEWDEGLQAAELSGAFVAGARFTLKPRGGPTVKLRLESVAVRSGFTDVTFLPLARLYDVHEMQDAPEGLRLVSLLRIEGPLAWLWRRLVAEGVARGVPAQTEALAARAAAL